MPCQRARGLDRVAVVVGGIIPAEDVLVLKQLDAAAVYTPKDFDLNRIMSEVIGLIKRGMGKGGLTVFSCFSSGRGRINFSISRRAIPKQRWRGRRSPHRWRTPSHVSQARGSRAR